MWTQRSPFFFLGFLPPEPLKEKSHMTIQMNFFAYLSQSAYPNRITDRQKITE